MKLNILCAIIVIAVIVTVTTAQDVTGVVIAGSSTVVKNAPYSADSTSETIQTLFDGNTILKVFKTKLYRDGEGRTRREELPTVSLPSNYLNLRETVTITDSVAGFNYYLNPVAKTARRLPITPRPTVTTPPPTALSGYKTTSESLGDQTIEGIVCSSRVTKTIIVPQTIGNEKEIVTTSESCFSNELKVILLNKRNDPQTGNNTTKLTNITRTEPDKSLFTIPADYKIIN